MRETMMILGSRASCIMVPRVLEVFAHLIQQPGGLVPMGSVPSPGDSVPLTGQRKSTRGQIL